MSPHIQYASFLVRLWRLPGLNGSGTSARWQSEVEHIQSGKTWSFNTLEDLCAFFTQQAECTEGLVLIDAPEADQEIGSLYK